MLGDPVEHDIQRYVPDPPEGRIGFDEAVRLADARGDSKVHVKLISLAERGLRPVLCQHNAGERGIGDRIAGEVEVESVIENGRIAEDCDRYLAFT